MKEVLFMAKETKVAEPVAEKKVEKKAETKKVYHVAKRAEDNMWTIKFANGEKVIKLCKTKEEALQYAETLAKNQGGTVSFHASKGKNKGKIQKY